MNDVFRFFCCIFFSTWTRTGLWSLSTRARVLKDFVLLKMKSHFQFGFNETSSNFRKTISKKYTSHLSLSFYLIISSICVCSPTRHSDQWMLTGIKKKAREKLVVVIVDVNDMTLWCCLTILANNYIFLREGSGTRSENETLNEVTDINWKLHWKGCSFSGLSRLHERLVAWVAEEDSEDGATADFFFGGGGGTETLTHN